MLNRKPRAKKTLQLARLAVDVTGDAENIMREIEVVSLQQPLKVKLAAVVVTRDNVHSTCHRAVINARLFGHLHCAVDDL
jgi:hypothetical protein